MKKKIHTLAHKIYHPYKFNSLIYLELAIDQHYFSPDPALTKEPFHCTIYFV